MKIGVICPTYNRPDRHGNLYRAFCHQTHSDRHLYILDDSLDPSPVFHGLRDPRVTYVHDSKRVELGTKRNRLIEMVDADVVAQFDDDDYYAPAYLESMSHHLGDADLYKLSAWAAWREADGSFWVWDTTHTLPVHSVVAGNPHDRIIQFTPPSDEDFIDRNVWGFGFSYVFRRSLWEHAPMAAVGWSEDFSLIDGARQHGAVLKHGPDRESLVMHVLHSANVSKILPQYRLPPWMVERLFGPTVKPWLRRLDW